MFNKKIIGIVLLSTLAACGGGGSSSPSGDPVVSPPVTPEDPVVPEPTTPEDPDVDPPAVVQDGRKPRAQIQFPWRKSSVEGGTITVRGTATDESGIASVRVNGQEATIISSGGASSNKSLKTSGSTDAEVEWEVELELARGSVEVAVEVTDLTGEHEASADVAEVQFYQVPTTFSFDTATQRLVGTMDQRAVDYRFATASQEVFSYLGYPISSCFDATKDQLYYVDLIDDLTYGFKRVSLHSSATPEVIYAQQRSATVPEFTTELYCDPNNLSLYFLVHRALKGGYIDSSTVYKIALEPTPVWSVLHETDHDSNDPKVVGLSRMAVTSEALIAHEMNSDDIIAISTEDGSVTQLYENYSKFAAIMSAGSTRETIYAVHYDGIDVINTADDTFVAQGYTADGEPLAFSQIRSAAYDEANQRVLVGDSDLQSIVAVDLVTGERSLALTSGIGDGPKMIQAQDLVMNGAKTKVYVIDSGGNAAEKVLEIDLESGDRKTLGNINKPFNEWASGIVLDEPNGFIYAATFSTVFKINIGTGDTEEIASVMESSVGDLQNVTAIALDLEHKRLLIADAIEEAIFALHIETHEITLVSKSGERGAGDAFGNINGLAMDSVRGSVYVTNQLHGTVQQVNLETGDRETLPIPCDNFGEQESLKGLTFNTFTNELIVIDERLTIVNTSDHSCTYEPSNVTRFGALSPFAKDLAFALDMSSLMLVDLKSFERVNVSK